jgi:uncharacterized RDD family membrane protein YckC
MDPYNSADAHAPVANPYAAPVARVAQPVEYTDGFNKSSRGARLGAYLLDGLIGVVCAIPLYVDIIRSASVGQSRSFTEMLGFGSLVSLVALLALLTYNLVLLHRNGQTLAKKWVGIRIVRKDGSRAGLGRIVGLRYIVPGAISAIPFVGGVFGLLDPLFIFGEEKRCLHDMLADTIVVDA